MSKPVSGNPYASFPAWDGVFLQENLIPFSENETSYLQARGFDCREMWRSDRGEDRYVQSLCSKTVGETQIAFYRHEWAKKDEVWDAIFFWNVGDRYYTAYYPWATFLFTDPVPDTISVRVPDDFGGMKNVAGDFRLAAIDHVIDSAIQAGIFSLQNF